jgi:hypothetical protein
MIGSLVDNADVLMDGVRVDDVLVDDVVVAACARVSLHEGAKARATKGGRVDEGESLDVDDVCSAL